MKKLTVGLGERSYPILIGPDLLGQPDQLTPYIRGKRVLIVTNETVAPLYLDSVQQALAGFQIDTLVLPDGEQYKTLDSLERIFSCLLENHHGRDTTLLALGGGVVGDMAGFAAACYQRGVDFIQLPTTLLAQVDSSVGGKTAVNHPLGKNMIGAFWQPRLVLIDIDTLSSLPRRELSAGMAEVIKYGILGDAEFFDWLETNIDRLMALQPDVLAEAIERCCQLKADIVAADETERGQRALLNLGHTFGHAIEAEQGYGNWLHGEGVAAGMVLAARLAVQLGSLDAASLARIEALIRRAELPTAPPADMGLEAFVRHMRRDKKVQDGTMRFILPEAIGHSVIRSDISEQQLAELFANAPS